jgi:hypothetical protein
MTMIAGGSNGITFPNSSNTSASTVTSKFSPAITDTANVMKVNSGVKFNGTTGLFANNTTYTTAP